MMSPEDLITGDAAREAFSKWIFLQELNEVYLLLDFISGRPDKHLIDLNRKIVCIDPGDEQKTLEMPLCDVLRIVSALRYPPDDTSSKPPAATSGGAQAPNPDRFPPSPPPGNANNPDLLANPTTQKEVPNRTAAQLAERIISGPVEMKAAFLLRLKDVLNNLTFPAKGSSVAYTTMFAEYPGKGKDDHPNAMRLGPLGWRSRISTFTPSNSDSCATFWSMAASP